MSITLVVFLAISANPYGTTPDTAASAVQTEAAAPAAAAPAAPRTGRELADAAHTALRHWLKVSDDEADAAARELLGIYREILKDTGLARSQRESLRLAVRGRLDQLCTQIEKRIARENKAAKPNGKSTIKPGAAVASVAKLEQTGGAALAQVGVQPAAGNGAAGQNANADNGQALVEMIQTVICPKCWDVNGGGCSIYYWQQQHAIVVRATGDVHEEVSDAIDQLNRAGH